MVKKFCLIVCCKSVVLHEKVKAMICGCEEKAEVCGVWDSPWIALCVGRCIEDMGMRGGLGLGEGLWLGFGDRFGSWLGRGLGLGLGGGLGLGEGLGKGLGE